MLLPTTLPTARSVSPPSTAPVVTASSGAEVATDTTVRPTTSADIPMRRASADAPRTRPSPPTTSSTSPATMSPTFAITASV